MALDDPFEMSSPPSSPGFGPVDSSPPTSPMLRPIQLDSPPPAAGPSHPFAASSSANRRPPLYEKKNLPSVPYARPGPALKYRAPRSPSGAYDRHGGDRGRRVASVSRVDREAALWDEAITSAIDNGNGTINLGSCELSYIPQSIGDLGKFFVTPVTAMERTISGSGPRLFSRTFTPTGPIPRSLERTASVREDSAGLARQDIQMYLSVNNIRRLPRELFSLSRMTVLTLRSNNLTYLPPEIALFKNLVELNIPNNKLKYLPAEMLGMKLVALTLHNNPFREPPLPLSLPSSAALHPSSAPKRICGPTIYPHHPDYPDYGSAPIPPLSELCFRVLLSPSSPSKSTTTTVLADLYTLPFPQDFLPAAVHAVLGACVPESVAVAAPAPMSPNRTPRASRARGGACGAGARSGGGERDGKGGGGGEEIMGAGVCPNPSHASSGGKRRVFVRHVEERFTWEDTIAGLRVGVPVPVRWRGCTRGCLVFLDGGGGEAGSGEEGKQERGEGEGKDGEGMDVDMEEGEVVVIRPVDLGAGLEEDFEMDA